MRLAQAGRQLARAANFAEVSFTNSVFRPGEAIVSIDEHSDIMANMRVLVMNPRLDPLLEKQPGSGHSHGLCWKSRSEISFSDIVNKQGVFLGMGFDDLGLPSAHFAINAGELADAYETHGSAFHSSRSVAVLLPPSISGVVAQARALLHWTARCQYCSVCGSATTREGHGRYRKCASPLCGEVFYPHVSPCVIMLIESYDGQSALLGRQPTWAKKRYSTLAGFVEPGETLEDAVHREVYEESGVRVGSVTYEGSQPWPFPSSLMVGFTGRALSDDIAVSNEELEDARWFNANEVDDMLCAAEANLPDPDRFCTPNPGSISHYLIHKWLDKVMPL